MLCGLHCGWTGDLDAQVTPLQVIQANVVIDLLHICALQRCWTLQTGSLVQQTVSAGAL